jgi:hypothetical protein
VVKTNTTYKPLIQYFCVDETYPAIQISDLNSTELSPRFYIEIFYSSGTRRRDYIISANTPKFVIDLTAYLAATILGETITDTKFMVNEYGGTPETFYKDCTNLLSNIFISYTYDE